MKILFLTPRIPFPPLKGDQVVAYHRLRTLGPKHDITLLTFTDEHEDPGAEAALAPYCSRIVKIPHGMGRIAWNLACYGLWSDVPLQVIYYRSPAFRKALLDLLKDDFQIIHAFLLRLLPYLVGVKLPVILECIDSMRLNMSRQVSVTTGPKRWVYQEELRRLDLYEPSVDRFVDRAIFVSPIDAQASGSKKSLVLSLGVELPNQRSSCSGAIVVFSGNMGYGPNIQAVEWFVRHCWAEIRQAVPEATFRVLGGGAPASVRAFETIPGIEIVGRVNDMMKELQNASVSVAPMQSGSGMQFKILEGMACNLPVVTTNLGLGAIQARQGEEIEVADSSEAFSRIVIDLLKNPDYRIQLGDRARLFLMASHSWEEAALAVEQEYLRQIRSED